MQQSNVATMKSCVTLILSSCSLAAEKIQKEIDEFVDTLGPDGYVIVEGKTYDITPPPPNDTKIVVTYTHHRIMSSVTGGVEAEEEIYKNPDSARPSPYQYVQVEIVCMCAYKYTCIHECTYVTTFISPLIRRHSGYSDFVRVT